MDSNASLLIYSIRKPRLLLDASVAHLHILLLAAQPFGYYVSATVSVSELLSKSTFASYKGLKKNICHIGLNRCTGNRGHRSDKGSGLQSDDVNAADSFCLNEKIAEAVSQ